MVAKILRRSTWRKRYSIGVWIGRGGPGKYGLSPPFLTPKLRLTLTIYSIDQTKQKLNQISMQLKKIESRIFEVRDQKVILDFDLAELYETETKYLKRAVRVNIRRFPSDFMFELTKSEWENLRCNFSTSKNRGGNRYLPFAFTEQGIAMLSSILNSDVAIDVNIAIMRAFVLVRNFSLTHKELTKKLKDLEAKYNRQFKNIYEAINYLIQKDKIQAIQAKRKRIGFK